MSLMDSRDILNSNPISYGKLIIRCEGKNVQNGEIFDVCKAFDEPNAMLKNPFYPPMPSTDCAGHTTFFFIFGSIQLNAMTDYMKVYHFSYKINESKIKFVKISDEGTEVPLLNRTLLDEVLLEIELPQNSLRLFSINNPQVSLSEDSLRNRIWFVNSNDDLDQKHTL